MKIIPQSITAANRFIGIYHRHNKPIKVGGLFALGLMSDCGELIGVAIAGRPIARLLDDKQTLEILRVCIREGQPNGASMLYARVKRIGMLMGYKKIITYTLDKESGATMRAIGATGQPATRPHEWSCPSRRRKSQPVFQQSKIRWDLTGNEVTITAPLMLTPLARGRGMTTIKHQIKNREVQYVQSNSKG